MYEICGADPLTGLISLAMLVVIGLIVIALFSGTKSRSYRKLLADLYVAGKIKLIAKKDGIDLADEMKDFRTTIKQWRMENRPLDEATEVELKDKIEANNDVKGLDLM